MVTFIREQVTEEELLKQQELEKLQKSHMQYCPLCKRFISDMPGTPDAICKNCGFKDPCCE